MTIDLERPKSNTQIYDTLLQFKDAGLVAASAAATVSAAAKVLDLGLGRVDGNVVIDVTAIEVATGDEVYDIFVQYSNSSTFASGIVSGSALSIGAAVTNIRSAVSTTGRYELPFTNVVNNTQYRYARLFTRVAGTIATGINYTAFATKH